jgi:hypothetical protein
MKSILTATGVLGVALSVFACASKEEEPTEVTRQAICRSGGGGGSDCVNDGTGCPAECGTCFSSAEERIELRNLWECETAAGGGGGGGGGEPVEQGCSNAQIRAAQQDCERRCQESPISQCFRTSDPGNDRYDPFPLGQVVYCAGSRGIHSCTIRNGAPVYTCANDLRWCGQ